MTMMHRAFHGRSLAFAFATSLALSACTTDTEAPADPEESSDVQEEEEANRALLHDYHVEVWEHGRFDQAMSYLGPGFVLHSVPVLPDGQTPGPDFFVKWLSAFSDLTSHEDAILSGGDRVSIQWTITATHTGDFFGIAPTQRKIHISGMDVLRVEDGKFVEQWGGVADQMDDVIQQLTSE
jgi:predicted SnoaL-like aldol condensation-catalyzing enzyme